MLKGGRPTGGIRETRQMSPIVGQRRLQPDRIREREFPIKSILMPDPKSIAPCPTPNQSPRPQINRPRNWDEEGADHLDKNKTSALMKACTNTDAPSRLFTYTLLKKASWQKCQRRGGHDHSKWNSVPAVAVRRIEMPVE